jgi:hypothetical protein
MALTRAQYDIQYMRLEKAISDLKTGGSLLHAVARGYYLIHLTASYLAAKFGVVVTHASRGRERESEKFSHQATVLLVETLYKGERHGNVSPGSAPGIANATLKTRDAARHVQLLQRDREDADYGPTSVAEPYTLAEADERLNWAKTVADDLRRLL